MFRNYFKVAIRNILRNKTYSTLNIFGLAAGMAVALMIGLWVHYQYSYDRFLPDYKQIYQVRYRTFYNGVVDQTPATALPLAEILKSDIPGIRRAVHTDWTSKHSLVVADKKLYLPGNMAGEDFLKMFRFPLLQGNRDLILKDPYSIVLTESTAKELFGNENPINKIVRVDNKNDLKVTGVLKELPDNSTFQFKFLIPFSYFIATDPAVKEATTTWENGFLSYVELQPNVSYAQIEPELKKILKKYIKDKEPLEVFMQPMQDWHLYSDFKNGIAVGGLIDYVRIFSIIGLLILIIACINFMNLSTARSEKRAKEVGIRKAVGSYRRSLVFQFLIESLVITSAAFIVSLVLVKLSLPFFNTLTKATISIPLSNTGFWIIMIGYVLATCLLAGSRPAFYFSSINPVKVLKGVNQAGKSAILPRKILVTLQFSCSIALIISTVIIYQQIQHARDRPIGYDVNRLMITEGNSDLDRNYVALKNDLLGTGVVSSVTKASVATNLNVTMGVDDWPGKLPGETFLTEVVVVNDSDYFKTLRMPILEGKNFSGDRSESADANTVILNEAAVKRMRLIDPLNQSVSFWGGANRVIGVVRDASMTTPFAPSQPTFFVFYPQFSRAVSNIMYRLSPSVNTHEAISKLAPVFNKYNPGSPYEYRFADDDYAAKFSLEVLIGKLAALFAALAISISCIGLFGLAAYMAERRTKEIGIRKVLGASVAHVWLLLSKEFIVLVIISCLIASPVAFFFLHRWLQDYYYRINIGAGVFILSAIVAIVITLVTVSFQAIKAALVSPAKSLKTEI